MSDISLIANTGIHMTAFPLELDFQEKFKLWYHEWYDKTDGEWKLELLEQVNFEQGTVYYSKKDLRNGGYSGNISQDFSYDELKEDGIFPIANEDKILDGYDGEIFKMTFDDRQNTLEKFTNVWRKW